MAKTKVRNWLAVHAKFRKNAGTHGKRKYNRKPKHKKEAE